MSRFNNEDINWRAWKPGYRVRRIKGHGCLDLSYDGIYIIQEVLEANSVIKLVGCNNNRYSYDSSRFKFVDRGTSDE